MINNIQKPLVFLGTNVSMWYIVDAAKKLGIEVAGVIDDDYHGQGEFQSLPVLAKQDQLQQDMWQDYQFFCATSWQPNEVHGPWHARNRSKRSQYISMLDELDLDVATIVHPTAQIISYNVQIGRGVFLDKNTYVGSNTTIGDYTNIWYNASVGHNNTIGRNCVMQRYCTITGGVQLGDNVYIGMKSSVVRDDVTIASGTFIHPGLTLLRGTVENEVVSLAGRDLRKVYFEPTES
jgi:acetyltransferase-like isoleucine patch superfamily enzyme